MCGLEMWPVGLDFHLLAIAAGDQVGLENGKLGCERLVLEIVGTVGKQAHGAWW